MAKLICLSCVYLLTFALLVEGFYLPFLTPTNFCTKEMKESDGKCQSDVFVHVNKLDSVEKILPYEYSRFDFCEVKNNSRDVDPAENLGQVVFGERLRASPYEISFNKNESYKNLCNITYTKEDKEKLDFLRERIHESYMHQWVIDNMPVTWCYAIMESEQPFCTTRFPVGCSITSDGIRHDACYLSNKLADAGNTYVFNHHHLVISTHDGTRSNHFTDGRIVRAQIQLASCATSPCGDKPLKLPEKLDKDFTIPYSYSVEFQRNPGIRWGSRWGYILSSGPQTNILMVSLISSTILILVFAAIVGCILRSSLSRDVNSSIHSGCRCRSLIENPTFVEAFCPPAAIMLLSVFVGNGAQILIAALVALLIYCLGFLSPVNRGALGNTILVLPLLSSFVAGFVSATLYKVMGGLRWKSNVLMTSFFVPGIVFGVFFTLNLFLWYAGSSAAIPFTTLLALLCLWFGISVPLTFFGAFLSPTLQYFFLAQTLRLPVCPSQTPQEIGKSLRRRQLCESVFSSIMGGLLPFICIYIHFYFFINSLWNGWMFYEPGFVMLAFLLQLVACAEISLCLSYYHLSREAYRWWWRSFFSTGTTAFYLLLFATHFYFRRTAYSGFFSAILYFGYTFIIIFLFLLLTGSVGFLISLRFALKIHSSNQNYEKTQSLAAAELQKEMETEHQVNIKKDIKLEEAELHKETAIDEPQKETEFKQKEIPPKTVHTELPPKEVIAENRKEQNGAIMNVN